MAIQHVPSRDVRYSSLGLPGAKEFGEATTHIVATLIIIHLNRIITTDKYHIQIPLNMNLSMVEVLHQDDCVGGLRTSLTNDVMRHTNIDVLQMYSDPSNHEARVPHPTVYPADTQALSNNYHASV